VLGLEISTPFSIIESNTGWTGRRRLVFEWPGRFQDKKKKRGQKRWPRFTFNYPPSFPRKYVCKESGNGRSSTMAYSLHQTEYFDWKERLQESNSTARFNTNPDSTSNPKLKHIKDTDPSLDSHGNPNKIHVPKNSNIRLCETSSMIDSLCTSLSTLTPNSLPLLTHFAILENTTPWRGDARSFSNLVKRAPPNIVDVVPSMCLCEGEDVYPSISEVPNWCFACHFARQLKCWEIYSICEECCDALCGCVGGRLFDCFRCGKKGKEIPFTVECRDCANEELIGGGQEYTCSTCVTDMFMGRTIKDRRDRRRGSR
jgi:hypothetical protein